MSLESFERKIAVLVESIFSKGNPRGIEPAELGRRLAREIERESRIGVRKSIAPNVFSVGLSRDDARELAELRNRIERELKLLAEETVENGDYELLGPVSLKIVEDPELKSGTFYIDCAFKEEPGYNDQWEVLLPSGTKKRLGPGTHTIGRLPGAAIVIDDPRVSRRHAELVVGEGIVTVYDLGSTNGTFLNGVKLARPTEMASGDILTIGTTDLTIVKG